MRRLHLGGVASSIEQPIRIVMGAESVVSRHAWRRYFIASRGHNNILENQPHNNVTSKAINKYSTVELALCMCAQHRQTHGFIGAPKVNQRARCCWDQKQLRPEAISSGGAGRGKGGCWFVSRYTVTISGKCRAIGGPNWHYKWYHHSQPIYRSANSRIPKTNHNVFLNNWIDGEKKVLTLSVL